MLSISALKLEGKWEQLLQPLYGTIIQICLYRIGFEESSFSMEESTLETITLQPL